MSRPFSLTRRKRKCWVKRAPDQECGVLRQSHIIQTHQGQVFCRSSPQSSVLCCLLRFLHLSPHPVCQTLVVCLCPSFDWQRLVPVITPRVAANVTDDSWTTLMASILAAGLKQQKTQPETNSVLRGSCGTKWSIILYTDPKTHTARIFVSFNHGSAF